MTTICRPSAEASATIFMDALDQRAGRVRHRRAGFLHGLYCTADAVGSDKTRSPAGSGSGPSRDREPFFSSAVNNVVVMNQLGRDTVTRHLGSEHLLGHLTERLTPKQNRRTWRRAALMRPPPVEARADGCAHGHNHCSSVRIRLVSITCTASGICLERGYMARWVSSP